MPTSPDRATSISAQLEVRDLRLVIAVASEGSLTSAGLRLNVTQPALSRHLALLERRIGAALFVRTGQRMEPTPTGELLLQHARDVVSRVEGAESALRAIHESPRRSLRIGTDCYTGYHWLPHVLSRYSARHPHVEAEIAFDAVTRPMPLLRANEIDVALITGEPPRSRTGYTVTRLFTDEYVAVVAPGHPLATRGYIEARDLADERVLLISPPSDSSVMARFIRPARVTPRLVADVQLVGAIAALVEASYGVGMIPSWTIAPEVRSGRLVPLRLGRNGLVRTWAAVVTAARGRERWVSDFVNALATGGPALGLQPIAPK